MVTKINGSVNVNVTVLVKNISDHDTKQQLNKSITDHDRHTQSDTEQVITDKQKTIFYAKDIKPRTCGRCRLWPI